MLIVPLGAASARTWFYERWIGASDAAAQAWVKGTGWDVKNVKQEGSDIVISVVGPGTSPPVQALRAAVRKDVPPRIPVLVIEENGATTKL